VLLGYIIRNLVARAKNSHFAALFHPKGDKHESVFLLVEIPRVLALWMGEFKDAAKLRAIFSENGDLWPKLARFFLVQ